MCWELHYAHSKYGGSCFILSCKQIEQKTGLHGVNRAAPNIFNTHRADWNTHRADWNTHRAFSKFIQN
jgi:hypothetical protein